MEQCKEPLETRVGNVVPFERKLSGAVSAGGMCIVISEAVKDIVEGQHDECVGNGASVSHAVRQLMGEILHAVMNEENRVFVIQVSTNGDDAPTIDVQTCSPLPPSSESD